LATFFSSCLLAAAVEGAIGAYMVLCLFVLGRWLL